jgi:hypothetical protein
MKQSAKQSAKTLVSMSTTSTTTPNPQLEQLYEENDDLRKERDLLRNSNSAMALILQRVAQILRQPADQTQKDLPAWASSVIATK